MFENEQISIENENPIKNYCKEIQNNTIEKLNKIKEIFTKIQNKYNATIIAKWKYQKIKNRNTVNYELRIFTYFFNYLN